MNTKRVKIIGDETDPRWKVIARHSEKEIFGFFGEYQFLSSMWQTPVHCDLAMYPSVENAYQASKFVWGARRHFMNCSPEDAKRLSTEDFPKMYTDAVWKKVKVSIMTKLHLSKFSLNKTLRSKLLATGDALLVEANWWEDTFWGVHVLEDGTFVGENNQGKLLMGIRKGYAYGVWNS